MHELPSLCRLLAARRCDTDWTAKRYLAPRRRQRSTRASRRRFDTWFSGRVLYFLPMDKAPGDYIFVGAFPTGDLAERIQKGSPHYTAPHTNYAARQAKDADAAQRVEAERVAHWPLACADRSSLADATRVTRSRVRYIYRIDLTGQAHDTRIEPCPTRLAL